MIRALNWLLLESVDDARRRMGYAPCNLLMCAILDSEIADVIDADIVRGNCLIIRRIPLWMTISSNDCLETETFSLSLGALLNLSSYAMTKPGILSPVQSDLIVHLGQNVSA